MRRGKSEEGFTLIEILVALSVFSLAVMALLNATGQSTRTAGEVGVRSIASVVADNQAAMLMLDPAPLSEGRTEGVESQAGRLWRWTRLVTPTRSYGLMRVDFAVAANGDPSPSARLTVFRVQR